MPPFPLFLATHPSGPCRDPLDPNSHGPFLFLSSRESTPEETSTQSVHEATWYSGLCLCLLPRSQMTKPNSFCLLHHPPGQATAIFCLPVCLLAALNSTLDLSAPQPPEQHPSPGILPRVPGGLTNHSFYQIAPPTSPRTYRPPERVPHSLTPELRLLLWPPLPPHSSAPAKSCHPTGPGAKALPSFGVKALLLGVVASVPVTLGCSHLLA